MMSAFHDRLLALFLLAVATAMLATACDLTASCTTIGCPQDQVCNDKSGECEEPSADDCRDSGVTCAEGEQCDRESGLCRPLGASCREQSCPPGQTCNATSGFCEAVLDCQIDPCTSPAEVCDEVTNRCVPKPCDSNEQCGTSHYCSEMGECLDGCRPGESACPEGQFCRVAVGAEVGQCTEECETDTECPLGQRCESSGDGFTCLPQSCEADADCRSEAVCKGEFCVPPPCTSDEDCAGSEFCELATGRCIGGSCEDDLNAPNHTLDEARSVESGEISQAVLCPGAPDWYAFDLRSADTLSLRLEHQQDADLDLYVYAEDRQRIALNQQTGTVSRITLVSHARQTVYVEVRNAANDAPVYSIRFERNPEVQCRDDSDEENDSLSEASELSTTPNLRTPLSLTICGSDEDWFVLRDLDADLGLSLDQSNAAPHVQTQLLGPGGAALSLSGGADDQLQTLRIRRLGVAGDYYLRVRSLQNRSDLNGLQLGVEVTSPFQCSAPQAHNTPETAVSQSPGPPELHSLCPVEGGWEVDWIALSSPDLAASLYVQVSPSIGLPEINVDLLESRGQDVEPVRSAVLNGAIYELRAPIEPEGVYFLRVSADGEPGRIVEGVDYQIFYRFELN